MLSVTVFVLNTFNLMNFSQPIFSLVQTTLEINLYKIE